MTRERGRDRSYLKNKRKELRSNSTGAEAALWNELRRSQLEGRKFRRQTSFHNFIVDFYCPSEMLVVELDGPIHRFHKEKDEQRQKQLEDLGLKVLRFTNADVYDRMQWVKSQIIQHFKSNQ